jgi:hypothetical protein
MDFKKSFISVCFGVLLCIGSGYSEVFWKVLLDNDGDNGRLMISSSYPIISGSTTCATGSTICATIPINGGKLGEYVLACVSKMSSTDATFSYDGTKYKFELDGANTHNCLREVSFYNDATGTNIDIITQGGKHGIIKLPFTANRQEQRKADYMVSLLADAMDNYYIMGSVERHSCICFNKAGDIITDMYAYVSLNCSACNP